jgi:uncharacterized Zn-finger protein
LKTVGAVQIDSWQADCPYCAALCQFDTEYLADVDGVVQCENCEKEFKMEFGEP